MAKLRALLVGATGIAGQQFVSALRDHPWFEIGAVAASPRNAGKRYDEAVAGARPTGMLTRPKLIEPFQVVRMSREEV